jgi:hypothetical protein
MKKPIDIKIERVLPYDNHILDSVHYLSKTLDIKDLEEAAQAAIANMGTPDRFILDPLTAKAYAQAAGIDWAWHSLKWEKLKAKLPGLPENISDEQIDEMGRAEKKLAKILYGKT